MAELLFGSSVSHEYSGLTQGIKIATCFVSTGIGQYHPKLSLVVTCFAQL
eukprot:COSAG06_NODE_61218_length_268_cov_0.828402_1_plen_49_part_01